MVRYTLDLLREVDSDGPYRPKQVRACCPSHLSESPVRVAFPNHLSESSIRVVCLSHLSVSPIRVAYLSPLSESPIRVACLKQLSESPIRVAYPSRLFESGTYPSLPRDCPDRLELAAPGRSLTRAHERRNAHARAYTHTHTHTHKPGSFTRALFPGRTYVFNTCVQEVRKDV